MGLGPARRSVTGTGSAYVRLGNSVSSKQEFIFIFRKQELHDQHKHGATSMLFTRRTVCGVTMTGRERTGSRPVTTSAAGPELRDYPAFARGRASPSPPRRPAGLCPRAPRAPRDTQRQGLGGQGGRPICLNLGCHGGGREWRRGSHWLDWGGRGGILLFQDIVVTPHGHSGSPDGVTKDRGGPELPEETGIPSLGVPARRSPPLPPCELSGHW